MTKYRIFIMLSDYDGDKIIMYSYKHKYITITYTSDDVYTDNNIYMWGQNSLTELGLFWPDW